MPVNIEVRTAQAQSGPNEIPTSGLAPQQIQRLQQLVRERDTLRQEAARIGVIERFRGRADALSKAAEDRQQEIQSLVNLATKNQELTGEQKNALASGSPSPLEFLNQQKSQGAIAAAKGKRMADVIEAGGQPARNTVNTLNVMEDAINTSGGNLTTGPGAESMLKLKQAAANLGFDVKGLTQSEVIVKLNAQLAAQAAKSMTARPSQLEFKAFMANNPGLQNSVAGTKALINILRQVQEQNIALGQRAMRVRNPDDWGDIENHFYETNHLVSPFTGQPMNAKDQAPAAKRAPGKYNWTPEGGLQPR